MTSIRDTMIMDVKVLANETISNSAIYFVLGLTGVPEMIFSNNDNSVVTAVKSGTVASAVNLAGAKLRQWWPWLELF